MKQQPKIYIGLPILNEFENLTNLIKCLKDQSVQAFELVACVNQYDAWWENPDRKPQCLDNQKSIQYLESQKDISVVVIDKSSKGSGWPEKKGGVGWARKTVMDYISNTANPNDLIVSIDADTYYPRDYFESIINSFKSIPEITGLSLPYYHQLNGRTDQLILRYEIYMRNYLLNMLRIDNPYAYTALGSAIAVPVWAYRKIGGLTPVKSGEDFYFLQKLAKTGKIGIWAETKAYPSARFSDRVLFGTGPALIKGEEGNWESYPIYPGNLFDKVKETFDLFPDLFKKDIPTPMDDFLKTQFRSNEIWSPLRKNYKDKNNFVKACMNKVDGLRILQFLKKEHQYLIEDDGYQIDEMQLTDLNQLRNTLFEKEIDLRKQIQITGI